MRSIPKLAEINKSACIKKYDNAVSVRPSGWYGFVNVKTDNLRSSGKTDGRIKGMSPNTLSRLRQAIARTGHKCGDYSVYGVCLTIPWGEEGELSQADGREIWRIFLDNSKRIFNRIKLGAIYRVELQERRAVHWHLMVYLPKDMGSNEKLSKILFKLPCPKGCDPICLATTKSNGVRVPLIRCERDNQAHYFAISILRLIWANACYKYHCALESKSAPERLFPPQGGSGRTGAPFPSLIRTYSYCVHCQPLDGVASGIGYLASHTSKHKQEQLGYEGKQWGFIGRRHLVMSEGVSVKGFEALTPEQRVAVFRSIRRWAKKYRPLSVWLKVKPRMIVKEGHKIFTGLSVRSHNTLYLFGVPDEVFDNAIRSAAT